MAKGDLGSTTAAVLSRVLPSVRSFLRSRSSLAFIDTNLPDLALRLSLDLPVKNLALLPVIPDSACPYGPFLPELQSGFESWDPQALEALVERLGLYPPHRRAWVDILSRRIGLRQEDLISEELRFERYRLHRDIARLLVHRFGETEILLIVHQLEFARFELVDFFMDLIAAKSVPKLHCLVVVDFKAITASGQADTGLKALMSSIPDSVPIIKVFSDEPVQAETTATLQSNDCSHTYQQIIAMYNFHCFDRVIDGLTGRFRDFFDELERSDPEHWLQLYEVLARSYLNIGEYDLALYHSNQYLEYAKKNQNPRIVSDALRCVGDSFFKKNEIDSCIRYTRQAHDLAVEHGYERGVALANFLLSRVLDTTSMAFHQPEDFQRLFSEMEVLFSRLGYRTYLCYALTRSIHLMHLYRSRGPQLALEHIERGIALAQSIQNDYLLSFALHARGLLLQTIGQDKDALASYHEALGKLRHIGNEIEFAMSHNSLGYFYFARGKFDTALTHYRQAMRLLSRTKEYKELCTTLVNMAFCYVFSFQYKAAVHYLETVLRIIGFTNIVNLPYHPRFYLYAVLGLSYVKSGKRERAEEYYGILLSNPSLQSGRRIEYLLLLEAALAQDAGNEARTIECYEAVLENLEQVNDEALHVRQYCLVEYAWALHRRGRVELAQSIARQGMNEITKPDTFVYYRARFEAILDGRSVMPVTKLPFVPFDSSYIIEIMRQDAMLSHLNKKIMESNFLNMFQNILFENQDLERLVAEAGKLLHITFLFDHCLILERQSAIRGQAPYQLSFSNRALEEQHLAYLMSDLVPLYEHQHLSRAILDPTRRETPLGLIYGLVAVPLISQRHELGYLFFLSEHRNHYSTPEELRLLTLAARQLADAIELRRMHNKLLEAATIDELTLVFNRKEIRARIDFERRRVMRQTQMPDRGFCLLYLDLDDFKYFNDTFGHKAGDTVLRFFAEVMQESIREVDSIGRLGGDEFSILLTGASREEAVAITERVLQRLADQQVLRDYFIEHHSDTVEAFDSHPVRCSIGVVEFLPHQHESMDDLLHNADLALYEAKHTGKNTYVFYSKPSQ